MGLTPNKDQDIRCPAQPGIDRRLLSKYVLFLNRDLFVVPTNMEKPSAGDKRLPKFECTLHSKHVLKQELVFP